MQRLFIFLFVTLLVACNQTDQKIASQEVDSAVIIKDTTVAGAPTEDTILSKPQDTSVANLSAKILQAVKSSDYAALAPFIHPAGVRLSRYGHVDTLQDPQLTGEKLLQLAKTARKLYWGRYDGTGDSIQLSLQGYVKKFVYDVDFANAKQKSVNQTLGTGNAVNNLTSMYPGCDFVELYFPGFNPKYDGMDWKALRLVFKKEHGKTWLVGVVHDQWTV